MPGIPSGNDCVVDLRPQKYQSSINVLRAMLGNRGGAREFLRVAVQTPRDEFVEIQIRLANAYIVGFKGESSWYCLKGEKGGWGKPLSLGGNYNNLGHVGTVSYDDLGSLGDLSRHGKGVAIDKRLIAILIAITAESARFATVSTYFIGLTNSTSNPHLVGHTVDFESLKRTYFNHWANPPDEERVPGKVYHPVKSDILLPHA